MIGAPVAFSYLVLGGKKAYCWIELGLEFAGGELQKESGAEDLRVLARE